MNLRPVTWILVATLTIFGLSCGHRSQNNGDGGTNSDSGATSDATGDGNIGCGLVTCASANAQCGPIGDGCGGTLDCGGCQAPATCGGGGTPFQCGGVGGCTPRTCADAGAECGAVADGCGGLTPSCGSCSGGQVCGGGGVANKCGSAVPCTGLCNQQMACTPTTKTKITGIVTAPGHDDIATWGAPDPINAALVYVPNGAAGAPTYGVEPFSPGVSCDSCSSLVTGDPLVAAVTGTDGSFTINNAPCGTDIPLVIQLGRWRRQIVIPSVACCDTTALTNAQTHLPRSQIGKPGDVRSDIPLMAFSSGNVDTLHCVLRNIGIEDSEFTNPDGNGRVRIYQDNGALIDGSTPAASTLYGSQAELDKHDMVLFECVGGRQSKSQANQDRVRAYADKGGRVFATHFSYVWLTNSNGNPGTNTGPQPWSQTADWDVGQGSFGSSLGRIDTTLQGDAATQTRRNAFADWLVGVGASTVRGQIPVNTVRHDFDSVNSAPATKAGTPAQQWIYTNDAFNGPLHFTFDTPVSYAPDPVPTTQCGRVLYSDFHVRDANVGARRNNSSTWFPNECTSGHMTPQEKTLEFMLFDLASCVGTPPAVCVPKTCEQQGYNCGQAGTGCDDGTVLECGTCPDGQVCGGGGVNQCGMSLCTPRTCADVGAECGIIGDGCGNTVDCGQCTQGTSCGAGGVANQCGGILL